MSTNTNTTYAATASASISGTSNVSMSVTPGSSGTTVVGSTRINYSVSNAISYRLTLSSNSTRTTLASANTSVSTESIPTLSSNSTLNALSSTAWGFCINTGTTACTASSTFRAARSSSNVYTIASGTLSSSTTAANNYATSGTRTLTYGAKIYPSLAAGTYSNTQIISLTAEDRPDGLDTISTMQEMTSAICAATRTPSASETTTVPTKQLIDTRDNKTYWVAKLADGNCWMTQNLALTLASANSLTPDDSDVSSNWKPASTTTTMRTGNTSNTSVQSFRHHATYYYVVKTPNAGTALCSSYVAVITSCAGASNIARITTSYTDDFVATGSGSSMTAVDTTNMKYDAHYILGHYYTWNAATAGTGGSITDSEATDSICPKGWHLPTGNNSNSGSFTYLINAYGIEDTAEGANKLGAAPIYLHRGGRNNPDASGGLSAIGSSGEYWTSTAASTSRGAYNLLIRSASSYIQTERTNARSIAFPIRCVAR